MSRRQANDRAALRCSVVGQESRLGQVTKRMAGACAPNTLKRTWHFISCMLAAAIWWSGTAAVAEEPDRFMFDVVGVKPGDWLNVRERIDDEAKISSARIVASLPPGTRGVMGSGASRMIGKNRWFEVTHDGVRGWVNGRFLKPGSGSLGRLAWTNLFCSGTEPFWSVKVINDAATYATPEENAVTFSITIREPLPGRPETAAVQLALGETPQMSLLVTPKEWCSDGMSDFEFGFEATLLLQSAPEHPRRGCCSLLR